MQYAAGIMRDLTKQEKDAIEKHNQQKIDEINREQLKTVRDVLAALK